MRRVLLAAGVTAAVTTLAAGCSSSGASTGSGSSSGGAVPHQSPCAWASWPTSPTPRRWSASRRASSPRTWARTSRSRPRCSARAPRRPPRCWPASWTRPTSGPTRPSTPGRSPAARPSRSSPVRRPAARRWWSSPASAAPAQLKGQKLATPSLGNTQDVALRYWLKQHGLTTTQTGGGDVPITPIKPQLGRRAGVQVRPDRRRLGAGARMTSRWCRTAARCWSTRPACGRAASSSPPTSSSPRRS